MLDMRIKDTNWRCCKLEMKTENIGSTQWSSQQLRKEKQLMFQLQDPPSELGKK